MECMYFFTDNVYEPLTVLNDNVQIYSKILLLSHMN
jgi:hypothetical protein